MSKLESIKIQYNEPSSGKHYSLQFLSATPLSLSRTLERLFELTLRLSRAIDLPPTLLPEVLRNKDTVRCAVFYAEVPGHRQEHLKQTVDCVFVENTFLFVVQKLRIALGLLL